MVVLLRFVPYFPWLVFCYVSHSHYVGDRKPIKARVFGLEVLWSRVLIRSLRHDLPYMNTYSGVIDTRVAPLTIWLFIFSRSRCVFCRFATVVELVSSIPRGRFFDKFVSLSESDRKSRWPVHRVFHFSITRKCCNKTKNGDGRVLHTSGQTPVRLSGQCNTVVSQRT